MDDKRKYLTDFFINKGLEPHQAAGIVGNLEGESSLNPTAVGDHGTSGGLAQWHNDRLDGLNKFAFNNNADANAVDTQAEYLWHELNTSHKSSLEALRNSKDVAEATTSFETNFERPKVSSAKQRIGFTEKALNFVMPTAEASEDPNGVIYADSYEEAVKAKRENPTAQIFIKEDAVRPELNGEAATDNALESQIAEKRDLAAKPEKTSQADSFLKGAAQGITLGFGDELSAGLSKDFQEIHNLFSNNKIDPESSSEEKYQASLKALRDDNKKAEADNPGTYAAGNVAGAVAIPLPGAAVAKVGVRLSKIMPEVGIVAKTPKALKAIIKTGANYGTQGAAYGGVVGAGDSEADNIKGVLKDAAQGAEGGAVTGMVLGAGGKAIQKTGGRFADFLSKFGGENTTQAERDALLKKGDDLASRGKSDLADWIGNGSTLAKAKELGIPVTAIDRAVVNGSGVGKTMGHFINDNIDALPLVSTTRERVTKANIISSKTKQEINKLKSQVIQTPGITSNDLVNKKSSLDAVKGFYNDAIDESGQYHPLRFSTAIEKNWDSGVFNKLSDSERLKIVGLTNINRVLGTVIKDALEDKSRKLAGKTILGGLGLYAGGLSGGAGGAVAAAVVNKLLNNPGMERELIRAGMTKQGETITKIAKSLVTQVIKEESLRKSKEN